MSYLTILVASFFATLSLGSFTCGTTDLCLSIEWYPKYHQFHAARRLQSRHQLEGAFGLWVSSNWHRGSPFGKFFFGDSLVVSPDMPTDEPIFGMQSAEYIDSDSIVAHDFALVDGGITTNDGDPVFASNPWRKRTACCRSMTSLDGPAAEVYCESVRSET
jgi:hypothetical protein